VKVEKWERGRCWLWGRWVSFDEARRNNYRCLVCRKLPREVAPNDRVDQWHLECDCPDPDVVTETWVDEERATRLELVDNAARSDLPPYLVTALKQALD